MLLQGPPRGGPGFAAVLRRLAPVTLVAAVTHGSMMLVLGMYIPYLYTRVQCCSGPASRLGVEYDVTEPAMVLKLQRAAHAAGLEMTVTEGGSVGACDVPQFAAASEAWSLSPMCPNRAYVQQAAQHVMGVMEPLQKLFACVVLPVGGSLSDRLGRSPVLASYVACFLLACLLSALDASVRGMWGNGIVYVAGCLFGLCHQPKDSILNSAVADILGNDEANKGRAFVLIGAVNALVAFLSNSGMYMYLRNHNESYAQAWMGFAGLCLAIMLAVLFLLPETLPRTMRGSPTSDMFNPFVTHFEALRLVMRDRVLVLQTCMVFLFYAYFLGFETMRPSYLTSVGFRMEDAMLPEILVAGATFIFSIALVPVIPHVGMWHMSTLGNSLFAVAYGFVGPFMLLVSFSGPYIASVIFACAMLVTFPAFYTIVSQRVEEEHQGKCQAAVLAVGTLGAVVGVPFYNEVLFNATAHGLDRARCPIASMLLAAVCVAMSVLVTLLARRSPLIAKREHELELASPLDCTALAHPSTDE